MGLVENYPALKKITNNQPLLSVIQRILGEKGILFQDMAMIKPPKGREKPWHQDHAYFDYPLTTKIVGVWIALNDAEPSNGCMHVIGGSHRWKLDYRRDDVDNNNPNWVLERPEIPSAASLAPVACELPAGHCHFHHCLTLHGSAANTTDRPRRSYILHLMPGTTRRLGHDWNPRMGSVEGVEVGDIVRGPDYPELASVKM